MGAELFLTRKYFKAHWRQCLGVLLCVALFLSAFMTVLLYRDCSYAALDEQHSRLFGTYTSVTYGADPDRVRAQEEEIRQNGDGVAIAARQIWADPGDVQMFLGTMDEPARQLANLRLREGRWPEKPGEIAMEKAAYMALGLNAAVGEPVEIPLVENGEKSAETFVLSGIVENFTAVWKQQNVTGEALVQPLPVVITAPGGGACRCTST